MHSHLHTHTQTHDTSKTYSAIVVSGKLGCHRDLHANIGQGELGIITFKRLMNDPRFDNIPMLLETPDDDDTKWIKLLNSLMD